MSPRAAWPLRPFLVLLVLSVPLLAGCADGDDGDGEGPRARGWTNPYGFPIHFDGERAYDLALRQMYDDPATFSGPRHRIPGTEAHAAVAEELHAALDAPMRALGGRASYDRFDGSSYYGLDLAPVEPYLCPPDAAARTRVADLEFVNIVGRTSASEIGILIGAHWDSKRHADRVRDPQHAGEPILAGDDGAGSTAAVVELARAFAAAPPGIALTFVLFDGEDGFERDDCHPLAGSLHYAQQLSEAERASMRGMILLDMVGNASATFYKEGNSRTYASPSGRVDSSWLLDLVWDTAAAMGVAAFEDDPTSSIMDDHVPFLHEGLPAIDIIRYENGFAEYWHTTRDDHRAIQPEGLDQVGAVVEATVRRLAADPSLAP